MPLGIPVSMIHVSITAYRDAKLAVVQSSYVFQTHAVTLLSIRIYAMSPFPTARKIQPLTAARHLLIWKSEGL
jgi:hypothetical protein